MNANAKLIPVEIDKGILIPKPKITIYTNRRYKYPYYMMEIGDSFLVPEEISRKQMESNISSWKNRHKYFKHIFIMRITSKGLRVWRIH